MRAGQPGLRGEKSRERKTKAGRGRCRGLGRSIRAHLFSEELLHERPEHRRRRKRVALGGRGSRGTVHRRSTSWARGKPERSRRVFDLCHSVAQTLLGKQVRSILQLGHVSFRIDWFENSKLWTFSKLKCSLIKFLIKITPPLF